MVANFALRSFAVKKGATFPLLEEMKTWLEVSQVSEVDFLRENAAVVPGTNHGAQLSVFTCIITKCSLEFPNCQDIFIDKYKTSSFYSLPFFQRFLRSAQNFISASERSYDFSRLENLYTYVRYYWFLSIILHFLNALETQRRWDSE